ncbi:M28 family peptidase [Anaerotardibacter muris]|uniref:M28 family peptidase n=1 Tax=Anaerotardibacter muris TaxID=2941505 RepID=UPI0020403C0A|nr:M28 family peptidase [Anaerotardibacter muris]
MAEMMDDIAHLSQEIGPRPAGTEEEQQAALYIADELQKSAGFSTVVEDVSCASNGNTVRLICFAVAFLCTLLAVILPVLSIPCFIISLLIAVLFACEALGKPILSRFLRNGVSQNVVAKYNPTSIANANKRRKIILVTHYDSSRVQTEYQGVVGRYLPIIRIAEAISLVVAPLVLLIKMVFFASEAGGFAIVLTVLQVLCLIVMALPLASVIKTRFSPYNEAANNDAAGVAVLLDVARTVGNGLVSAEEMAERAEQAGVEIHGEEAAREAGVMPEDVEVTYQVRPRDAQMTPEESLAAAKAAIAALTGKPVADKVPLSDISSRLVQHGEFFDTEEDVAAAAPHFEVEEENEARLYTPPRQDAASANAPSSAAPAAKSTESQASAAAGSEETEAPESFVRESVEALQPGLTGMDSSYQKQVPSWAKAAQEKAHANKPDLANASSVSRSRFADAPAAKMSDAARRRDNTPGTVFDRAGEASEATDEENVARETIQQPESELSKRLAALRSEIDSAADAAAPALKAEVAEEVVVDDQPVSAEPVFVEEEIQEDPVLIEDVEPHRQTTVEVIEQEEARTSARARSSRRSAQKNNIGGFFGRASSMVNSVSSKVANLKGNRGHEDDVYDEYDEYEDDVVLVEETFGDVEGHTVSMPPIDVMQIEDDHAIETVALDEAVAEETYEDQGAEQEIYEEEPVVAEAQFVEIEQPAAEPVSPIMGMEEMTSDLPQIQQETVTTEDDDQPDRHVIVLPDVIAPVANNMEGAKQRAPMAADPDRTQPQAPALLSNMLPQIGDDGAPVRVSTGVETVQSRTVVKPLGGLDLPDFNTNDFERIVPETVTSVQSTLTIPAIPPIEDATAAAGSAGSTGSFATVTNELVEESVSEADFVEDADDSVFEEGFTQTGAFAGPDYVEMPQSRVGRLFGRFGKKKKQQEEQSIREWVDVDSSYEARAVGKERGSWESFRNEDETDIFEMDFEETDDGRDWNGGAFSLQSLRNRVSGTPEDADVEVDEFAEIGVVQGRGSVKRSVPKDVKITEEINNEMRLLRDFRHPDIDTEVWFVALGAEEALNSGMRAFIDEHHDELKGAIIVNLEGLGAGQFSFIDEEGEYRPTKVSSRMKRLLRQASERSRVPFETSKLLSRNTAAHVAAQRGFQAMTLAGMDDNQTAYYASLSDTLENVEPATLEQNSRFVLELLKSV